MNAPGRIVAIGGGGFAANPPNLAIDRFLLGLTGTDAPRVGFVPTATGDAPAYLARFFAVYGGLGCRPSYLPLFSRTPDVAAWVRAQDLIFVGGGNTRSMLAVWAEWGLPDRLAEALAGGAVLAGQSAGAICWFEQGLTDSAAGALLPMRGLGLVPGSCCPHYDGEAERKPAFRRLIAEGRIAPGIAIDDGAAALYGKGRLERVLAWREGAAAYRVERGADGAREERIEPERLAPWAPTWPLG